MNKIQKEKILIIADDVKTNRLIIKNIFKNEYTIYEAENGLEVMELFSTCPHVEALILDIHMPKMDGMEVLMRMQEDENLKAIPTVVITASADDETQIKILTFGITDVISKPFSPIIMWHRLNNLVSRKEAEKLSIKNAQIQTEMRLLRTDTLTGISNKQGFITDVTHLLTNNPQKDYIIVRWDVDNFKLYNDSLGIQIGNQYLKDIGDFYRLRKNDNGLIVYARYDNEHFVCCFEEEIFSLELEIEKITEYINSIKQGNHILKPRFGVVMVDDKSIDVSLLCDRASLALKTTKNTFATSFAWYDDSLRTAMLEEQEIINQMNTALENCEFVPYLQPQFDYKNNKIIGAEILARWKHPIKGLMPPSRFIPLFERNGFISPLDCHIWEETFKLLRKWIDT
ncbi:MAG: EAL domain-containing protein, partial [Anaerotignaceae bacterium]